MYLPDYRPVETAPIRAEWCTGMYTTSQQNSYVYHDGTPIAAQLNAGCSFCGFCLRFVCKFTTQSTQNLITSASQNTCADVTVSRMRHLATRIDPKIPMEAEDKVSCAINRRCPQEHVVHLYNTNIMIQPLTYPHLFHFACRNIYVRIR